MSRRFPAALLALSSCLADPAAGPSAADDAPSATDPAEPPQVSPPADVPVTPPDPVVDSAAPACDPPAGPLTTHLPVGATWPLPDGAELALDDAELVPAARVSLPEQAGMVRVRLRHPTCDATFDHTYQLVDAFPTDDAVAADAPRAWATAFADVTWGAEVDEAWRVPSRAFGPAATTPGDVCVLGDGGSITLAFDAAAFDGPGPDLAVFENAFSTTFLELARVEVSSDGWTFAAFDAVSRTAAPVGGFGAVDAAAVWGLAGRHPAGLGTAFDLAALRMHPAVRAGAVDLDDVRWVRVTDVIGDGGALDVFGRPIYDPWPTTATAGFDLDAVGLLNVAP